MEEEELGLAFVQYNMESLKDTDRVVEEDHSLDNMKI